MGSVAFAGRGGQGLVFAATVLANTLFRKGLYVAQLQSYGAEVRGGSVLAYVVFSAKPIENPFLEGFTLFLALHEAGLKRWRKLAEGSSIVVADSELVHSPIAGAVKAPLSSKVVEIGAPGRENVAALGLVAALGIADRDSVLEELSRHRDFEKNRIAFEAGYRVGLELAPKVKSQLGASI